MSSNAYEVRNPSCPSEVVGTYVESSPADVSDAIMSSRIAFGAWRRLTGAARGDFLYRWAAAIEADAAALAELTAKEVGKPIGEAKGEVGRCVAILRYYAGEAAHSNGQTVPALVPGSLQYVERRPVGVVGLITPWNFPLAIPLWKAAPALAFGNAVVIKASELSSLTMKALAKTAEDAGLPRGIFNTIYGGGEQGRLLLEGDINAISFTGSAATGKKVIEVAAAKQIRCQAEMGGKNPSIVLADADLDKAANLIAGAAMRFAGQKCTATSRIIIEEEVADAFMGKFLQAVQALKVGSAEEETTAVGPVVSQAAQERILAKTATFGQPAFIGEAPKEGWFVPPTVFDQTDAKSELGQHELFGPVVGVIRVRSAEEAIHVGNGVSYGLSASLFTSNIHRAMAYVNQIEAGMVRVNADSTGVDPHAPFGGVKQSSYGPREQGEAARAFYTESVTVQINP